MNLVWGPPDKKIFLQRLEDFIVKLTPEQKQLILDFGTNYCKECI